MADSRSPISAVYSIIFGIDGTCTYCGEPSECLDHVIPWAYISQWDRNGASGKARGVRTFSCKECNGFLGHRHFDTFYDRLKFVNNRIRKKYSRDLSPPKWDEEELNEIGPTLKIYLDYGACRSDIAKNRAGWIWGNEIRHIINGIREITSDEGSPKYRDFLHRYFGSQEKEYGDE